jgi:hypothetical protein
MLEKIFTMSKIWRAVTTCTERQWNDYGLRMARSFMRFWPPEIQLTVFAEDFGVKDSDQVKCLSLFQEAAWLGDWIKTYGQANHRGCISGRYDFRWDAVKFVHKIAALTAMSRVNNLIWLDIDTITHSPVNLTWLSDLFPDGDVAWLNRDNMYPECGIMMFSFPGAKLILDRILSLYKSGEIFSLPETHDSFVFQYVIDRLSKSDGIRVNSLSGCASSHSHPAINGPLGRVLDHFKGPRKKAGRTPPSERIVRDGHSYWGNKQ